MNKKRNGIYLEIHVSIGRNQEALVFESPLELDVDGLSRQLLHEGFWVHWRRLIHWSTGMNATKGGGGQTMTVGDRVRFRLVLSYALHVRGRVYKGLRGNQFRFL